MVEQGSIPHGDSEFDLPIILFSKIANGGWASWSRWSGCAAGICAGNQRIRTRTCTNPLPSDDGLYCDEGDSSQQQDCQSKKKIFIFCDYWGLPGVFKEEAPVCYSSAFENYAIVFCCNSILFPSCPKFPSSFGLQLSPPLNKSFTALPKEWDQYLRDWHSKWMPRKQHTSNTLTLICRRTTPIWKRDQGKSSLLWCNALVLTDK